jgi:hypothetical protein
MPISFTACFTLIHRWIRKVKKSSDLSCSQLLPSSLISHLKTGSQEETSGLNCRGRLRVTRLGNFSPIRLLYVDSLKKMSQNGNTLGYNLVHFHRNKLLKNMFWILGFFGLASVLATFQKIGQIYSESFGNPDGWPPLLGNLFCKTVNTVGNINSSWSELVNKRWSTVLSLPLQQWSSLVHAQHLLGVANKCFKLDMARQ